MRLRVFVVKAACAHSPLRRKDAKSREVLTEPWARRNERLRGTHFKAYRGTAQTSRYRTEERAAARLQHPAPVPGRRRAAEPRHSGCEGKDPLLLALQQPFRPGSLSFLRQSESISGNHLRRGRAKQHSFYREDSGISRAVSRPARRPFSHQRHRSRRAPD